MSNLDNSDYTNRALEENGIKALPSDLQDLISSINNNSLFPFEIRSDISAPIENKDFNEDYKKYLKYNEYGNTLDHIVYFEITPKNIDESFYKLLENTRFLEDDSNESKKKLKEKIQNKINKGELIAQYNPNKREFSIGYVKKENNKESTKLSEFFTTFDLSNEICKSGELGYYSSGNRIISKFKVDKNNQLIFSKLNKNKETPNNYPIFYYSSDNEKYKINNEKDKVYCGCLSNSSSIKEVIAKEPNCAQLAFYKDILAYALNEPNYKNKNMINRDGINDEIIKKGIEDNIKKVYQKHIKNVMREFSTNEALSQKFNNFIKNIKVTFPNKNDLNSFKVECEGKLWVKDDTINIKNDTIYNFLNINDDLDNLKNTFCESLFKEFFKSLGIGKITLSNSDKKDSSIIDTAKLFFKVFDYYDNDDIYYFFQKYIDDTEIKNNLLITNENGKISLKYDDISLFMKSSKIDWESVREILTYKDKIKEQVFKKYSAKDIITNVDTNLEILLDIYDEEKLKKECEKLKNEQLLKKDETNDRQIKMLNEKLQLIRMKKIKPTNDQFFDIKNQLYNKSISSFNLWELKEYLEKINSEFTKLEKNNQLESYYKSLLFHDNLNVDRKKFLHQIEIIKKVYVDELLERIDQALRSLIVSYSIRKSIPTKLEVNGSFHYDSKYDEMGKNNFEEMIRFNDNEINFNNIAHIKENINNDGNFIDITDVNRLQNMQSNINKCSILNGINPKSHLQNVANNILNNNNFNQFLHIQNNIDKNSILNDIHITQENRIKPRNHLQGVANTIFNNFNQKKMIIKDSKEENKNNNEIINFNLL